MAGVAAVYTPGSGRPSSITEDHSPEAAPTIGVDRRDTAVKAERSESERSERCLEGVAPGRTMGGWWWRD